MSPFVETIRIVDGELKNLKYHQARMERTVKHFWPHAPICQLAEVLAEHPQEKGIFKARAVYDGSGVVEVSYAPYHVRCIRRLKFICCDDIDYTYKSTDRSLLSELAAQKGEADEIIIVKKGLLTDTSYSNIALYDGQRWFTPRTPLLRGTMRQSLIDKGILIEKDIAVSDFQHFEKVALINAMMPLGSCVVHILENSLFQ